MSKTTKIDTGTIRINRDTYKRLNEFIDKEKLKGQVITIKWFVTDLIEKAIKLE